MADADGRATAAEVRAAYAAALGLVDGLVAGVEGLNLAMEGWEALEYNPPDWVARNLRAIEGQFRGRFTAWREAGCAFQDATGAKVLEAALLADTPSGGVIWRVAGRAFPTALEAAGHLGRDVLELCPVECVDQHWCYYPLFLPDWWLAWEPALPSGVRHVAPFDERVSNLEQVHYYAGLARHLAFVLEKADAPALEAALLREEAAVLAALASEAQAAALLEATARLTAAAGAGTVDAGAEAVEPAAEGDVAAGKAKGTRGKGGEEAEGPALDELDREILGIIQEYNAKEDAGCVGKNVYGKLEMRPKATGLKLEKRRTEYRLARLVKAGLLVNRNDKKGYYVPEEYRRLQRPG